MAAIAFDAGSVVHFNIPDDEPGPMEPMPDLNRIREKVRKRNYRANLLEYMNAATCRGRCLRLCTNAVYRPNARSIAYRNPTNKQTVRE